MKKMVGFRNTVIHEYQEVDVAIVEAVIERRLDDLVTFTERVLAGEAEDEV
ncbi:MAG TPA: HepT-like ribonuclease domain-containing protein [Spirochaetia bacterium]|nr:HepT-like ribonuclease domain-containing protein [Spirochaetia bacterium]